MIFRSFLVTVVALLVTACAGIEGLGGGARIDQRTTHGPTAKQLWIFRVANENGREPNFEETTHWEDQLDRKINTYLAEHPDVANALEVSSFRFDRQVTVGMSKEQVLLLLGAPVQVTSDASVLEQLARKFWPVIKGNTTEAWVYPVGWRLFFAGQRVVDITQYVPRFE